MSQASSAATLTDSTRVGDTISGGSDKGIFWLAIVALVIGGLFLLQKKKKR
jgi:LPXTG-motif cell wall-anchored protein